jgi:toxin ParE1/3/4
MRRILKREAAKRDLIEQWVWYAENASMSIADSFLKAVETTLGLLSCHPESGRLAPVTRAELDGIRRFPVSDGFERVLLFYFALPDGIDLVRVLHGSRDLERLLGEDFPATL